MINPGLESGKNQLQLVDDLSGLELKELLDKNAVEFVYSSSEDEEEQQQKDVSYLKLEVVELRSEIQNLRDDFNSAFRELSISLKNIESSLSNRINMLEQKQIDFKLRLASAFISDIDSGVAVDSSLSSKKIMPRF